MNNLVSAVVKTSSAKSCFVTVSADLAQLLLRCTTSQNPKQAMTFQVEWPRGMMYVSWSGEVMVSRMADFGQESLSVIEISRRFANPHGLQDGQQIVLYPVECIASCSRVHVDPFSADDWEILELHAGFVESNLLNQVRVVWSGQVVPIWINRNTVISIKIGVTEPNTPCVMLEEFTEVVVTPRQRTFTKHEQARSVKKTPGKTQINPLHSEDDTGSDPTVESVQNTSHVNSGDSCVRNNLGTMSEDCTEEGAMSKMFSYFKNFIYGEDRTQGKTMTVEDQVTGNGEGSSLNSEQSISCKEEIHRINNRNCCRRNFETANIDMSLRVQPMFKERNNKCQEKKEEEQTCSSVVQDSTLRMCSLQPSTIFVNPSSFPFSVWHCGESHSFIFPSDCKGWTRVVTIQKVLSPKERAQLNSSSLTKNKGDSSKQSQEKNKEINPVNDSGELDKDKFGDTTTSSSNKFTAPVVVKMVLTTRCSDSLSEDTTAWQGSVMHGHVLMQELLSQQLGVGDMSIVSLHGVDFGAGAIEGIILHPIGDSKDKVEQLGYTAVTQMFQDWVLSVSSEECPIIMGNEMMTEINNEDSPLQFVVSVLSHSQVSKPSQIEPYFHLTPSTLERVSIAIGDPRTLPTALIHITQARSENAGKLKCSIKDLGGVSEPLHRCLEHLLVSLNHSVVSSHLSGGLTLGLGSGAVLICGSRASGGCGRTSLAHALLQYVHEWPVCAHVVIVECIPLRSKRVETIQKQWQQAFTEAAWHEPSVILLDDLDHVISSPSPTQEVGGEALYRLRLAQVFKDLIANEIANRSKVAVIATSRSRDSLHSSLLSARGCHVFQCCVELSPPDELQREEILTLMVQRKFAGCDQQNLDLSSIALKTEGYSPKDLNFLTDRVLHFVAVRKLNHRKAIDFPPVLPVDFQQALTGFTPAALRGVSLHRAGDLGWDDVGGLGKVKEILIETLLWPTKYARLFAKCPLRLRSGLLLYGPPGTGKTLLAGVVAKECGLNFISIKGPELLSKYIGASEQAVRDMFTRAQSAKPCILFFDEFDSLAPRRGHDSTGVTDRVVNQLLTQLDGVEGLEGVYVLSATSRPDLIDPALLRPGRLDKCVYCPIPNKVERHEILRALSRNLPLSDDVNLKVVTDRCSYFTGADLKALLYNAQLEAIHRKTSKLKLYGRILDGKEKRAEGTLGLDVLGDDRNGSEYKQGLGNEESEEDYRRQEQQVNSTVLVASIEKGTKHLSKEEAEALQAEINALKESRSSRTSRSDMQQEGKSSAEKSSVLYISQSNLEAAASTMGPSVSEKERLRYHNIYETFVKSRGGDFSQRSLGHGRTTLA